MCSFHVGQLVQEKTPVHIASAQGWKPDEPEQRKGKVGGNIKERENEVCRNFQTQATNINIQKGLVSFSEATRFTPKKYEESKQWCATNGKPQPQHLLYPRTKGFIATVQHLRHASHVKAVYDLAIAYQKDGSWMVAPVFWDTLSVPGLSAPGPHGFRFHVHVRRFPIEELPRSDADLARWLEQRWLDKGEWLEGLRKRWAEEEKDEESRAMDGAKV